MSDFLLVFIIALFASFLTYLGAPAAERFDVSHKVVSGALQFAAGILTALVVFTLMPPAVRDACSPAASGESGIGTRAASSSPGAGGSGARDTSIAGGGGDTIPPAARDASCAGVRVGR